MKKNPSSQYQWEKTFEILIEIIEENPNDLMMKNLQLNEKK